MAIIVTEGCILFSFFFHFGEIIRTTGRTIEMILLINKMMLLMQMNESAS